MSSSTQIAATLEDLYRVDGVWDVDPVADRILKYRADAPTSLRFSCTVKWPMPNPQCRIGRSLWTPSLPDAHVC